MGTPGSDSVLNKIITWKPRTLKPYEKKFIKPGEFRYSLPLSSSIPKGNPTVCYDRQLCHGENDSENVCQESSSSASSVAVHSSQQELCSTPCHIEASQTDTLFPVTSAGNEDAIIHPLPSQSTNCSMQDRPFLDEADSYFYLLKLQKAISIFAECGTVLVVKDFCNTKLKLHTEKYILIQRQSAIFQVFDCRWLYWCDCDLNCARQISSLAQNLTMSYEGCNKLYEVADSNILCCGGGSTKRFGLVSFNNNKFVCLSCNQFHCEHLAIIHRIKNSDVDNPHYELIENLTSHTTDDSSTRRTYKPKLISFKKISFTRSQQLSEGLEKLKEGIGPVLLPDQGVCQYCGGDLEDGDPIENEWIAYEQAVVVTNMAISYCKVYYRPCASCDSVSVFEGQSLCVLNLGTYLVGYDVLRSYMHSFLHGRRPLFTFYQTWCDVHHDYGNTTTQKDFSYERLRHAWHSYLQLLDIDYNYGFSCPHCGGDSGTPDILVCDGTAISFQRRMWEWNDSKSDGDILKLSSSRFSDRVYLEDPTTRKQLKRYAGNGDIIRGMRTKALDEGEKKQLFSSIKHVSKPLHQILQIVEGDSTMLRVYRKLLLCLASPSPVCALVRPSSEVNSIIQAILKGQNIKEDPVIWNHLHCFMPIFFEIFEKHGICEEMKILLSEMWNIAITPFLDARQDNSAGKEHIDVEELSFFPSLTKYRNRGTFKMDSKKQKNEKTESKCQKRYPGHPTLLPGIFAIFCPHGVCYGFQVMASNESPNVPFTIFRTRFKAAPKVVVYDNACKLHQYCISRDPLFFKDTEFYVDRLHWDNHTSCCLAYDLSLYPQYTEINSQCCEQGNAGLKRIKDQLSYMTANNFMVHCAFYLWNKNIEKLKKYYSNMLEV